jgi:hypothetical protein
MATAWLPRGAPVGVPMSTFTIHRIAELEHYAV